MFSKVKNFGDYQSYLTKLKSTSNGIKTSEPTHKYIASPREFIQCTEHTGIVHILDSNPIY